MIASIAVRHRIWPAGIEYVYRPFTRYCPQRDAVIVTPSWSSAGMHRPNPPEPRDVWPPRINHETNHGVILELLHRLPMDFQVLRVELHPGCGVEPDALRDRARGKFPDLQVTSRSGPALVPEG